MKNRHFTTAAIVLHALLFGIIYANATQTIDPMDEILVRADYPRQSAFLLISSANAEIIIEGAKYELFCTPYQKNENQIEAFETPTGNFILYDTDSGTATARIQGKYYTFIGE